MGRAISMETGFKADARFVSAQEKVTSKERKDERYGVRCTASLDIHVVDKGGVMDCGETSKRVG